MKKLLYFASLFALITSCAEIENEPFDGSTSLDEVVDYSTFKAQVSDTYVEKELSTKADLLSHIGFSDKSSPALNVVFEDQSVAYEYNGTVGYYSPLADQTPGDKAKYMYSTDSRVDGAIVAAKWPTESLSPSLEAIKLRNMKSRIAISYEYVSDDDTDVESIKIGDIATEGEFVCGATLQYITLEGSEESAIDATQVDCTIDSTDGSKCGTYEAFVIPQTISQYTDYVAFTIDGVENRYYFKRPFVIEPHTLYNMTFNVKRVDDVVEVEITSQESIPDYDQGGNHTIVVNPLKPIVDTWDGETYATGFAKGDGSSNNPYLINNAAELALLMQNKNEVSYISKCYKLMINIDWDNRTWEPLAPNYDKEFTGTFDGNGKIIKNLSINYKYNMGGFIGRLGNQSGSTISPKVYGKVSNLYLKASVKFDDSENQKGESYGGIVGVVNLGSVVENCQFSGSVEGKYKVGGIAGMCSGVIVGCTVSNTTITATSEDEEIASIASAGAIAGSLGSASWPAPGSRIQYCLSLSNTVGGDIEHIAGIVGGSVDPWPNIARCYVSDLKTTNEENKIFGTVGNTIGESNQNKPITASWIETNFCANSNITLLDPTREYQFTTSQEAASMLNNTVIPNGNQTIEANWQWIANPSSEALAPIPSCINE